MASKKRVSAVGAVGALQKKIKAVQSEHQKVSAKLRAEKQVKTLTKRLAQKVNALEKAKAALSGRAKRAATKRR